MGASFIEELIFFIDLSRHNNHFIIDGYHYIIRYQRSKQINF